MLWNEIFKFHSPKIQNFRVFRPKIALFVQKYSKIFFFAIFARIKFEINQCNAETNFNLNDWNWQSRYMNVMTHFYTDNFTFSTI